MCPQCRGGVSVKLNKKDKRKNTYLIATCGPWIVCLRHQILLWLRVVFFGVVDLWLLLRGGIQGSVGADVIVETAALVVVCTEEGVHVTFVRGHGRVREQIARQTRRDLGKLVYVVFLLQQK